MNRWMMIALTAAVATAMGCFDAGATRSSNADATDIGGEVAVDGGADTGAGGDADAVGDPCGGCSGETPVCHSETGTCVECLDDGDCGGDVPICDTTANACVACEPGNESEWYPDADGDGFGDGSVEPTSACEAPEGMVDNADDCDDQKEDVHPDAGEVCNGRDDDCDGRRDGDDDLEPADCPKQKGLCQGAMIAACNDEGEYAACGAEQYGDAYRGSDDERWRCDGKDNDCDGEADEACCAMDTAPNPTNVGATGTDQEHPQIVRAVEGAPSGAAFLVAWTGGHYFDLQYVDRDGRAVGEESTIHFGRPDREEATGLVVTQTKSGYAAVLTFIEPKEGSDDPHTLRLYRLQPDLSVQGANTDIDLSNGGELVNPDIAIDGESAWVTYSVERGGHGHGIWAAKVPLRNGELSVGPFEVSKYVFRMSSKSAPVIGIVGGTPAVAWWNTGREAVRGAWLKGGTVTGRFHTPVGRDGHGRGKPMEMVVHDGTAHLLFPHYVGSESELTHLAVSKGTTGMVSGATALTGSEGENGLPSAAAVDRSGDGTADHLLVVWQQDFGAEVAVGTMPLDSPGQMTPRVVKPRPDRPIHPDLAFDGRAAVVWRAPTFGDERDVGFAPVSIDGVPICK